LCYSGTLSCVLVRPPRPPPTLPALTPDLTFHTPSGRAAAVAANAAISAQSKQTDGTVEEHHTEDANDGVDAEPEQESLLSFKVQKNAQTASVTANNKKRKVKPEEEEVAAQSQKTEDANGTFIFHKVSCMSAYRWMEEQH